MRIETPSPRDWTREPLLLLAALGVVIFALHHAFGAEAEPVDVEAPIRLDSAYVDGLVAQRQAAGRAIDREAIAAEHLREEVLVRRARSLGLDRGDPIVRRRLAERMELWLAAQVDPPEPTEAEVAAALEEAAAHAPAAPTILVFEHRFFSRSRTQAVEDARAAREGEDADGDVTEGDAFALGSRITGSRATVEERFGAGFAAAVAALEPGAWSAPIESALGVHLVRLIERRAGQTSAPSEPRVRVQLRQDARRAAVERAVTTLIEAAPLERE